MKSLLLTLLAVVLGLCLLPTPAFAAEAVNITSATAITATGFSSADFLTDGNIQRYQSSGKNATITMENHQSIAGIYLLFDSEYGAYTIRDNTTGKTIQAGINNLLHEYIDLTGAFGFSPSSITLVFSEGAVRLSEIYVFSQGTLPNWVQVWNTPLDNGADLLLFTAHGDDDQLFFAGMLPLYAAEKGLRVQTVYLTDHRSGPYSTNARTHEILNGLWSVGVDVYPVLGDFPDVYNESLSQCYQDFADWGVTEDALQSFVAEQIRRFRPLVAVGHDRNGEYGHGMHIMYTDVLLNVLDKTKDPEFYPESAKKYGTWDIPKLYLHLYKENPVTIDYDRPLSYFNGMTAFEVSQKLGYPCHESQQWTWFTDWLNGSQNQITKASQIEKYSPCRFGLYRTLVGEDVEKNDFFENIIPYAQQEQLQTPPPTQPLPSETDPPVTEASAPTSESTEETDSGTLKFIRGLSAFIVFICIIAVIVQDNSKNRNRRA